MLTHRKYALGLHSVSFLSQTASHWTPCQHRLAMPLITNSKGNDKNIFNALPFKSWPNQDSLNHSFLFFTHNALSNWLQILGNPCRLLSAFRYIAVNNPSLCFVQAPRLNWLFTKETARMKSTFLEFGRNLQVAQQWQSSLLNSTL